MTKPKGMEVCWQPGCPDLIEAGECTCRAHVAVCGDPRCRRPEHNCEAPVHYCERHGAMTVAERNAEIGLAP